jgi:hypothetical protein
MNTITQAQFDTAVNEAIEYSIYVERLEAMLIERGVTQEEIDAVCEFPVK